MKMIGKRFFISLLILISPLISTTAQVSKGKSIGISGGYSNCQTFTTESFFQISIQSPRLLIEPKIGLSYHSYNTEVDNINNLDVNSVGIFIEGAVYPFHNCFFSSIRWEIMNINWFTHQSMEQLDNIPSSFLGTSFYGIVGIDIPIIKSIRFRIYGTPGVRIYKVSDWQISTGEGIDLSYPGESYIKFAFQVNASLIVQITNKQK